MNISKLKLVTTFIFGGGVSGVIEYVLGVLKNALASLSDTTKEKIQAVLNLSLKVLSILEAVKILVPTKWQTAYTKTIAAVESCVASLTDLELTKEELDIICDKVTAAIDAWKSPDDDTCVDCKVLTMLIAALCVSTTFAVGFMRIENGSVEIPFYAARVVGMEAVSTNKTGTVTVKVVKRAENIVVTNNICTATLSGGYVSLTNLSSFVKRGDVIVGSGTAFNGGKVCLIVE